MLSSRSPTQTHSPHSKSFSGGMWTWQAKMFQKFLATKNFRSKKCQFPTSEGHKSHMAMFYLPFCVPKHRPYSHIYSHTWNTLFTPQLKYFRVSFMENLTFYTAPLRPSLVCGPWTGSGNPSGEICLLFLVCHWLSFRFFLSFLKRQHVLPNLRKKDKPPRCLYK